MSVNYYTKNSMRFQHFMLFFWKLRQTGREICLKKTGMIRQDHARLCVSKKWLRPLFRGGEGIPLLRKRAFFTVGQGRRP